MSFISLIIKYLKPLKPYWLKITPHCTLCLAAINTQNNPSDICSACQIDLPLIKTACSLCYLPLPFTGICGQCIKQPPVFHQAIAPYQYKFPIDSLITQFKYQSKWPIGRLLVDLLAKQLITPYQHGLDKPDYLICVPLAKKRLRERGFNQSEMLSIWLSKKLNIPMLNHIRRVKYTIPQQQLVAKERAKNLKQAFEINLDIDITGLHIAIVDDVITTGSTANAIADILLKHGAKIVDVYAIARTPQTFKLL